MSIQAIMQEPSLPRVDSNDKILDFLNGNGDGVSSHHGTKKTKQNSLSRTVTDRGWTSGHTGRVGFSYTRGYVLIKAHNFPITTFCLI